MAIIHADSFDGVTAPALPTGWVGQSNSGGPYHVTEASVFSSSPNGVQNAVAGDNSLMYWNTADDGNGGDAMSSVWLGLRGNPAGLGVVGYVLARLTTPAVTFNACTGYVAYMDFTAGGVGIARLSGGSFVTLATRSVSISAFPESYVLSCRCVGSAISARCQRQSDSMWLTASGSWQAARTDCVTVSNLVVSGAGKSGLAVFQNTVGVLYADDFLFETASAPQARRRACSSFT